MRVVFMGTPIFSVPALVALKQAGHDIVGVFCQPPRPANRGHKLQPSPVEEAARALGIPVYSPKTLRTPEAEETLRALSPDVAVVVAYGLILPQAILDIPVHGCLNIHGSLLPRWRGAAPIHRAILAGDACTGITTMRMDAGLDTGPMLLMEEVPILPTSTTPHLHDILSDLGARLIVETLVRLQAGTLKDVVQPEEGVTYASKVTREEGLLDWRRSAQELERRVRALTPWPGTFFAHGGEMIKVLEAKALPLEGEATPGLVLTSDLVIACGEGAFVPLKLQRPGRAPMALKDFLNGLTIAPGTQLELPHAAL